MEKKYENLEFTDDFMFCKVLENDKDLCKELLELILDRKVKDIIYANKQETITVTSDGKGIRLDVYLEDEADTVYGIEMQTTGNPNLPKRSRYYQGMIDLNLIEKGEDYSRLKKSYIIFINLENPFKQASLHKYTFRNVCMEDRSLELEDGTTKIFLTPDGTADDVSGKMENFLHYLTGSCPEDDFTGRIEAAVNRAREHAEWRTEYMTLLMRDRENIEKGRAEGADGLARLIRILKEDGREADVERVLVDAAYRNQLLDEYRMPV